MNVIGFQELYSRVNKPTLNLRILENPNLPEFNPGLKTKK